MKSRKFRPLNLPGSASEDQFHLSVAELLDICLFEPTFYTTFPAGYGKLSKGMAGKLRAKGMKPGMPDILIFEPTKHIGCTQVIGLELKVRGNTATSIQRSVHAKLGACGIRTYIIRSLKDVIAALNDANIKYRNVTIPSDRADQQKQTALPPSLFEFSPYRSGA